MMEAVVIVAGACQLASWVLGLVDIIEAPPKRKAPPTSANARRASDPRNQQTWGGCGQYTTPPHDIQGGNDT